ncbi:DNA polymerase I [Caproiciproducens sp. NJN-50]|uniref:DNA polymerase I n=1 Tax=Acutalibacteraceae TaxID=3082771 RepID=UPI000FFE18B5|nr:MULTISPECIES: DNA polymerase I [Acutalibacteraceae]QAT51055.1 DNA polymerase I [Caproiciproducens sp. NJN-50]
MKLLVLDGNSILNRAFYGVRLLTTKEGLYTNGIYGFLTILHKLKTELSPDAVAVAFDLRAPTFRHREYAGYKSNRKGMPPELAQQLPTLKELLTLLGYRLVTCEGFEADDILGTLAGQCEKEGDECVLATGDRDSLQLVGPHVTVRLASTKMGQPQVTLYDEAKIEEDYGVIPKEMIEIKAIQGDSSDCIPGVAGIGPKGAGQLIQAYHSIDYIYGHLPELEIKDGIRKKLAEGKDSAYLSRRLGTIRTDVPIDTDLKDYIPAPCDCAGAAALMAKLEFFSLIEKMGLNAPEPPQVSSAAQPSAVVAEHTDAAALLKAARGDGRADILADFAEGDLRVLWNRGGVIHTVEGEETLRALFGDASVRKNTHNVKPLFSILLRDGIPMKGPVFDTMLAGYLLNPSASGYEPARLAKEYGVPEPAGEWSEAQAAAAVLPGLADRLQEKIAENSQTELLGNIEIPLARVLAGMENVGFAVDAEGIRSFGEKLEERIAELQRQVFDSVGYEFNLNSPKQLGDALFVKLGLPHGKKTKTGWSTGAETLEKLRYDHPAVEMVLDYRALAKLKSTYCDGLLKVVAPDGRIHSSFNQTETRTGRISSTEPNLQNIPVRTELGREMRRFFVARPGWVLVDADYSQIELRVLAHVANDRNMIQAFREEKDIHRSTAAQVFHMPEELVTPLMRSRAKAVNFGIVYGIGAFSLSKNIHVSVAEAKQYITDYLANFSGVDSYMKRVVEEAKENGYVQTLFGRRRYLPELKSSNFNLRSFGERVARNMPIQGTAADVIKIAMIRVRDRLDREKMKAKLILQVHDELIVEAPKEEAERVAALLTEEMQNAVSLSVPMIAEAKTGTTWYEAKA